MYILMAGTHGDKATVGSNLQSGIADMDLMTSGNNPCRNGSSMFLPLDPPVASSAGTHQSISNSQNTLWDSASGWVQSSHNGGCRVGDFDAQRLEWPIRTSAWDFDVSYHHAMQGADDNRKMNGSAWEVQGGGLFGGGMDATQKWLFPISSSSGNRCLEDEENSPSNVRNADKSDRASKDGMDSGRANTAAESNPGKQQALLRPKEQQEGAQFRSVNGDAAGGVRKEERKVGEMKETQQGYGGEGGARREPTSGDPPSISLKLGKRNYFEDASEGAGGGGGGARGPATPVPCNPGKKQRLQGSTGNVPRCQVEGCRTDLTTTKDYHRRHKVCEMHSKAAKVVAGGCEQRFCQQCSRFHVLSEFDDAKRSCRKRLASHNERRRKSSQDTSALAVCIAQDDRRPFSGMIDRSCFMQHPILPLSSSVFDHGDARRAACSPRFERFEEQAALARRMQLLNGQRQSFLPCLPRHAAERLFTLLQGSKAPGALNLSKDMSSQELHHLQIHGPSSLCQGVQTLPSSAGASTLVGGLECVPASLSPPGMPDSGRALSLLSSQSLSSSITHEYGPDPSRGTHYSLPTTEEKLLSLPTPPRSLPFSTTMLPSAGGLLDSLKRQRCLPSGLATIQDAASHPVLARLFQGQECGGVGGQSSQNGRPTLDLMQLPSPSSQGTQFATAQIQVNGGEFSELQELRPYEAAMFDTHHYA